MNHSLAREIYGNTPWHVDSVSFGVLSAILEFAKNSNYNKELKNNTPFLIENNTTKIVTRPWQLNSTEEFNGIGVIKIDGAITNNGGESSYGMLELSSMMISMARDTRVKGFIVLGDSGGGSSIAVETMGEAINRVRNEFKKPVHGLIEKGGTSCSAMYMIHSYCDKIFAQSEMSIIGSNGTMIQFEGRKANTESDGVKYIRLYATKSVKKNEDFEQALNKDNYELIINNLLDPINERALKNVLKNRPQLKSTNYDSGVDIFAKDGVGTYIDGFATMQEVINMILKTDSTNKNNNNKMTKEKLKQEHPEVYNEIYNEGVSSEKDRVESWMAHLETDSDTVVKGIESGKAISNGIREKLFVKSLNSKKLKDLTESSADEVITSESETTKEPISGSEELKKSIKNAFKGL